MGPEVKLQNYAVYFVCMPFNNFELIQNYIFCVYVLYIDIPYMRKGDQNTKLHLIFESTRKKSEGPRLKPQNYIVLHFTEKDHQVPKFIQLTSPISCINS